MLVVDPHLGCINKRPPGSMMCLSIYAFETETRLQLRYHISWYIRMHFHIFHKSITLRVFKSKSMTLSHADEPIPITTAEPTTIDITTETMTTEMFYLTTSVPQGKLDNLSNFEIFSSPSMVNCCCSLTSTVFLGGESRYGRAHLVLDSHASRHDVLNMEDMANFLPGHSLYACMVPC